MWIQKQELKICLRYRVGEGAVSGVRLMRYVSRQEVSNNIVQISVATESIPAFTNTLMQ
jgi:hypothetical protein